MLRLMGGNIYAGNCIINELSFLYDVNTGILKVGDYEDLDKYYKTMLLTYNKLKVNELAKLTDNLGLPELNIPRMCDGIRLVKFNNEEISKETQIRFIEYMLDVSCNGGTIKELVDKPEKNIIEFLDSLYG